ncbi:MAG: cytochrome c oxidase subunit CcoP [Chitinophagaceae bacterium]|nr:cytochrome c oxidase subunit CcoP [Chitinophagaceae bacterium]
MISCVCGLIIPMNVFAAGPPKKSDMDNPLAITLMIVIGALLLVIALLAHVLIGAAQLKTRKFLEQQNAAATKGVAVILLCMVCSTGFAQAGVVEVQQSVQTATHGGLSTFSFYALIAVIVVELIVILGMLFFLRSLTAREVTAVSVSEVLAAKKSSWREWWLKVNKFRSMSEEKDIDMGHDYDNIRELDNKLPPWWLYGFYVTIIFAGVYLWRYHVSESAPLSAEELRLEIAKAEIEKEKNLKKAGNSIDENTVKMLTAAADLEAGQKIFTSTCVACHAADGGGGVGPNLTDEYWLHGGSVKDVFKTIKYGVPDKGMQPWKATFSPTQIAQLTSYIKSLKGAKVAKPLDPQGTLYKDEATTDTTKIAAVNQR